jgi:glycosyltransferase involved in cell wall biosynthesis
MKVVSVMTSDARGGGEYAAVDMLEALTARGHETVLITNQPGLVKGRGVDTRRIDLGPKLSRSSYRALLWRWPLLARQLRHALQREWPYDVLLVHYKKEQLLAASLPKRLRARLAWAEWGPVPYELRSGPARLAYLAAARRADVVMAVSPGTRDSVRAVGVPERLIHVVPNALRVDDRRFSQAGRARVRAELGIPSDALVIGCVSRFHPKKRNDVAVDAVTALTRDDVHLVMAGEGPAEDDLRARALPLGDRAHFIPTPGGDVTDVLSALDITVFCPSPTEGAPLAVIHSMLASRPCVATGAEGVAGLIVPGAGTIASPEHDPAAVAAAFHAYLDDESRRAREGDAARAIAEQIYSAPTVAERIEQLLAKPAIGGKPGATESFWRGSALRRGLGSSRAAQSRRRRRSRAGRR